MKAEYLIKKCLEREACFGRNPCPNISYCELFKDLYGCVPSEFKNLTEAEREAVSKCAKFRLRIVSKRAKFRLRMLKSEVMDGEKS